MKLKNLLLWFSLSLTMGLNAQNTLSLGNYDEIGEDADDAHQDIYGLKWGSYFDEAPINYYLAYSGCQLFYTPEELAPMKDKDITILRFKYYNEMGYYDYERQVKVILTETDKSAYEYDNIHDQWMLFNPSLGSPSADETIVLEGLASLYMNGILEIEFSNPYHYSGENNLVVTVMAEGDVDNVTDGGHYIAFYYAKELDKRMMGYCSDFVTMEEMLDEGRLLSSGASSINNESPVIQFEYTDGKSSTHWDTFVTDCTVDFNAIKGVTAYKVTGIVDGVVVKEPITEAPRNTPVLLELTVQPSFTESGESVGNVIDNQLRTSDGTVYGAGIYVLGEQVGQPGFVKLGSTERVPKGKAYLVVNSGDADFYPLAGTTAISEIPTTSSDDSDWYTLSGQRVKQPTHGIFVKQGKKHIIR